MSQYPYYLLLQYTSFSSDRVNRSRKGAEPEVAVEEVGSARS
jgi:hypothetical protein